MQFTSLPVSSHPDVLLRALEPADVPRWFAYLSQHKVFEHTSWDLRSADDLMRYADAVAARQPDTLVRFAIACRATNALIGTAGFHSVSSANRTAELAYDLSPAHWGRGIATAVGATLTEWALAQAGLQRVQATVLQSNQRSMRVLERCGFRREGLLRRYRLVRGTPGDFWMYARLAGDTVPA